MEEWEEERGRGGRRKGDKRLTKIMGRKLKFSRSTKAGKHSEIL